MKNKVVFRALGGVLAGIMSASMLTGCGSSGTGGTGSSSGDGTSSGNVLRVGMECAYAPFNWTQTGEEVKNGDTAVKIYGGGGYAYGYDVMIAKKLADKLGMEHEIHKVEWDSIGISMDSGEYDCIIAGMGRTSAFLLVHRALLLQR